MQTTIIINDGRVDIFHPSGVREMSIPSKLVMKRIKAVLKGYETIEAINAVYNKADIKKETNKVLAALKDKKLSKTK